MSTAVRWRGGGDKLNWECGHYKLPRAYFFVIIISGNNFISIHLGRCISRYPSVFNRPITSHSNWNLWSLHPISVQTSLRMLYVQSWEQSWKKILRKAGNEFKVDVRSELWYLAAGHHRERETDHTREEFYSVTCRRLMECSPGNRSSCYQTEHRVGHA